MKNIGQLMKQAQKLQDDMAKVQAKIKDAEMKGQSGAGLVTVSINGKGEAKGVQIDPSLFNDDIEILQDLIVAAFNDAKNKMDSYVEQEMKSVTGGLPLPDGLKLPF